MNVRFVQLSLPLRSASTAGAAITRPRNAMRAKVIKNLITMLRSMRKKSFKGFPGYSRGKKELLAQRISARGRRKKKDKVKREGEGNERERVLRSDGEHKIESYKVFKMEGGLASAFQPPFVPNLGDNINGIRLDLCFRFPHTLTERERARCQIAVAIRRSCQAHVE